MDSVTSGGWEPDALTAQVRFWEGSAFNRARREYCDTTIRKRVENSEHKPYPKLERYRSTHPKDAMRRLGMETKLAVLGDDRRYPNEVLAL
jgi:hypothetical protein